jgi:hypothetical protein
MEIPAAEGTPTSTEGYITRLLVAALRMVPDMSSVADRQDKEAR